MQEAVSVNYADPEEILQSLLGHKLIDCGGDDHFRQLTLDDGRVLIFIGLGIVLPEEYALH